MLAFQIEAFHFHVLPMRTRFPFRYGISSLTRVPHLVVTAEVACGGALQRGMAADGLPPKWFTKNPETTFEQDLAEMLAVIQNAARIARNAGAARRDYAAWWRDVRDEQARWAELRGLPGLLAGFGVSLMERAVLDALCRAAGRPLHELLRAGHVVADLGVARAELAGTSPADFLPSRPLDQVRARFTVGLGDWLTAEEVPEAERPEDGLPVSVEECARVYGLSHFKIKLGGDLEADRERLRRVAEVLDRGAAADWRSTLDGNEAFAGMAAFREYFERLRAEAGLRDLLGGRLLFVEQPLRRDVSLTAEAGEVLARWEDAPPLLIDEADGSLDACPEALRLGYAGVSHKNCKGILKGLANAATIRRANAADGGRRFVSGEDLASVAPVASVQDLAMQALLGVGHVERNGHHYFRGLSMWPEAVQEAALAAHGDLFRRHERGFAAMDVREGALSISSLNAAPFGCALEPDLVTAGLETLEEWIRSGWEVMVGSLNDE